MSHRIEKINKLIQKEISQILLEEIDFEGDLVTVTEVRSSPDFTSSKVLITVIPKNYPTNKFLDDSEIKSIEKEVLNKIQGNIYDIQRQINKKLKIRPVPKIYFEIDEGIKNLYKIDQLTNKRE
jgi:ribosome-binding factor A